ncbi:MAG: universal stress protein [Chitinophagaceae bacterium]
MKRLLVPIDFSPASRNASEYAASLSKVFAAEIYLLHVFKNLLPVNVEPEIWPVAENLMQKQRDVDIDKEIQSLRDKYSIKISGNIVTGGKSSSISKLATEIAADLIIMGMKRDKKHKTIGNTILKTIQKASIPVYVVPEEAKFAQLNNIVLAVDFNEMADNSSLDPLLDIVEKSGAWLRVLHVEKKGSDINASELAEKLQLGRVLSKVSYGYDRVENDDVEQGILHFVENHPTDLLVMVAHHHNILEQISGPVYTRSIGSKLKLPLLVLKNI